MGVYEGDGSVVDFQIPFEYLAKRFVYVYVDRVELVYGTDYTFLNTYTIRFNMAPEAGTEIRVRRWTDARTLLVDFNDSSILVASDLDLRTWQAIHIAEEARDLIDTIRLDENGNWDAQGNRIVNVGDPVDDQDAATKAWVVWYVTSNLVTSFNWIGEPWDPNRTYLAYDVIQEEDDYYTYLYISHRSNNKGNTVTDPYWWGLFLKISKSATPDLIDGGDASGVPHGIEIIKDVPWMKTWQYETISDFPIIGNTCFMYFANDTNKIFWWNGSSYEIVGSDYLDITGIKGNS